jgi:alkylation response protein AidB-like acyl-CoA dehydrogenase
MDLTQTDEQRELRATVRRFLADKSDERAVRRVMATQMGYDPQVWALVCEQGLLAMAIPEQYGGAGFSYAELGVVMEEMGAFLFGSPFLASIFAMEVLRRSGDDEAARTWLPRLASGELIGSVALYESATEYDPANIRSEATGSNGAWTVTGNKRFVLDGHNAELFVVVARTTAGISLFVIDSAAAGVDAIPVETMDQTRKLADVSFRGTPAALIGEDGHGATPVREALDVMSILLAAEQVGGITRVVEMAVDYAKQRIQFGRPIGSFQAIKHRCASMLVEAESARSAALYGLWTLSVGDPDLPVAARLAKIYCSQAYMHAAAANIQIHAGIGFTWEHPAHLYFKRAKASEVLFGPPGHHRALLADALEL